jgi:hypothetical protein
MDGLLEEGVDAAVAARMQRQSVLWDQGKTFDFVMCEAAFRMLLRPPAEMAGQLDRLLTVIGLPNVTLGIIPFGRELPIAPMVGFLITAGRGPR